MNGKQESVSALSRRLLICVALLVPVLLGTSIAAYAGKHPYRELKDQIARDVVEILIKHGVPYRRKMENPWLYMAAGSDAWIGGTPDYGIFFVQSQ